MRAAERQGGDGAAGGHRDQDSGRDGGARHAEYPTRRMDRFREANGQERPRAVGHLASVRHRLRVAVGAHPQDHVTQPAGKRGQRRHPGQRGRAQPLAHAAVAGLAGADVPGDPPAHDHGQPPVPVGEQHVQHRAGPPPGLADDQHGQGVLQPVARTGGQSQGVVARYAEDGRQVGAVQLVPQAQFEDLPLIRVQPGQGGADHPA